MRYPMLIAALLAACGPSAREVKEANESVYNTEFARVYNVVLAEVRKRYPQMEERPTQGLILTSWHPVRGASKGQSANRTPNTGGNATAPVANQTQSVFFVRFRVRVWGDGPWQVDVKGQASKWVSGEVPQPLRGGDVPPWLSSRTEELQVEIHRRLAEYAERAKRRKDLSPEQYAPTRRHLPGVLQRLLKRWTKAARDNKFDGVSQNMVVTFIWDETATPNSQLALVSWQTSDKAREALWQTLTGECAIGSKRNRVTCTSVYGEATFKLIDDEWRFVSFLRK